MSLKHIVNKSQCDSLKHKQSSIKTKEELLKIR